MKHLSILAGRLARVLFGTALVAVGAAQARTMPPEESLGDGRDRALAISSEAARAEGKALLARNKVVEALQSFRQAHAQDPGSAEALNGMAVCYDRLGRFEDSRTHYEMALGIDPTSPVLLNNYGLSLFLQGKGREAVRFLALAAASGDAEIQVASLRTLARIERQQAATPKALSAVQTVGPAESAGAGARIVRTSDHEQRLVLDSPRESRAVQMAAVIAPALSPEVAAVIVPIATVTKAEEARIIQREQAAIAFEREVAAKQAEMLAAARPADIPLPVEMRRMQEAAAELQFARADAVAGSAVAVIGANLATRNREFPLQEWFADQILAVSTASKRTDGSFAERRRINPALLAAGFAIPRPASREAATICENVPLGPDEGKREFTEPFNSDNGRLNDLAGRLHGHVYPADVAARVAVLQDLIERVRRA